MTAALVSTIIPVYNRPVLVREAVESVLTQTYQFIEVLIVDDGSTDGTATVCDEFAAEHPAVRVIHLPHQGRIGLVREAGRREASGEYLQYLDSDDLLMPSKFATMVKALDANPDCDIAYCYTRRYRRGAVPADAPVELTGETFEYMLPRYLSQRFWYTSTPLYRRRLCDKAGPWTDLLFWEDIEYDIRVATHHPHLLHCREYLTDVRDHDLGRACTLDVYANREQMRHAARASQLIFANVARFGLTSASSDLRLFIDEVRMLRERCRAMGLQEEANGCREIVDEVLGPGEADDDLGDRLRARIEPEIDIIRAAPGQTAHFPVRVVNDSPVAFRGGDFSFELAARAFSNRDDARPPGDLSAPFDPPLLPRESRVMELPVPVPDEPGEYDLHVDILWGGVTWLSSLGNPSVTVRLCVADHFRDQRWWLDVYSGNSATLTQTARTARVEISRALTTHRWHIQLNQGGLSLVAHGRYSLDFLARADRSRDVSVAVSMAHEPWEGLGLYRTVELEPDWQSFSLEFDGLASDTNARIHFDVGASDCPIEVADVLLRRV